MVQSFYNKFFTIIIIQNDIQCKLYILSLIYFTQECCHLAVVRVNTLKKIVKALNNLQIRLFERFVKFDETYIVLDLFVV